MTPPFPRVQAVAIGEMRSLARQKTFFVLRTLYAGLVAGMTLLVGWQQSLRLAGNAWTGEAMADFGAGTFSLVTIAQVSLAALLGALLGVASIHSERYNKTLGLLVLSRIHPWEAVAGKLLALVTLVVSVLLAGLPILALVGWAGGLDYVWLSRLVLVTLAAAAAGTATGLAFTLVYRSSAAAAVLSLTVLALPMAVAVGTWTGSVLSRVPGRLLLTALPEAVAAVASQNSAAGSASFGAATAFLWTFLMAVLGAYSLPRAAAAPPGRGLRGFFEKLDRFFEAVNVGNVRFGNLRPRPLSGNPVAWLTRTSGGLGLPQYGARVLVVALVASFLSLAVALVSELWGRFLIVLWSGAMIVVPLVLGATAFGEEKSRKTLGVLLATPLGARAILHGKLRVALRVLTPLALATAIFLILYGEFDLSLSWGGFVTPTFLLLGQAACAYFLALYFSLLMKSSLRAGIAAFFLLSVLSLFFNNPRSLADFPGFAAVLLWLVLMTWAGTRSRIRRQYPGTALTVLLIGLVPFLALSGEFLVMAFREPLWRATVPPAAAVFLYGYTLRQFDRALGRTR